jgi:DNA-binding CsgD family transcriptional regulator
VLALLTTGATAQMIADQLLIKPATVKSHLRSVYRKIGVANRVQATRCYLLCRDFSAPIAG